MNKSLIVKFFTTLLIFAMLIVFVNGYEVQASSVLTKLENDEPILTTSGDDIFELLEDVKDEKIMKYDAITNQTTEVDMDEIEQLLKQKARSNELPDHTESFDPLESTIKSNMLLSTNSATSIPSAFKKVMSVLPKASRCVCKATFLNSNSQESSGSAVIVGNRLALTAAHCIMDKNNNFYKNWVVYPAYNNGEYREPSCGWTQIYYSSAYTDTHSAEYDWCICVLGDPIGTYNGWVACQSYGVTSEMNGLSLNGHGYPYFEGAQYQYYTSGKIQTPLDKFFITTARNTNGMSGGPYYRTSDGFIVGVIHGTFVEDDTLGIGVRITQEMVNIINNLNSQ